MLVSCLAEYVVKCIFAFVFQESVRGALISKVPTSFRMHDFYLSLMLAGSTNSPQYFGNKCLIVSEIECHCGEILGRPKLLPFEGIFSPELTKNYFLHLQAHSLTRYG